MKTSWDSVAALMRELSADEQLALVDSDNRPKIKQFLLSLQTLLTILGTTKVRTTTNFIASEFFKVNTEKNASVKISYIWEDFKKWFLQPSASEVAVSGGGPYREPGVPGNATEVVLRYHTLNKRSVDGPIIAEIGGEAKAETTLAEISALMVQQSKGEQGALLNNGYANIFYVRDVSGALRTVGVDWSDDGWGVYAYSVGIPRGWGAGARVFSRDS